MSFRAVGVATVSVVLVLGLSGCALGRNGAAGAKFVPRKAGVLTVATSFLPAPGFWFGPGAKRGFESGLALALAHKLGLEKVRVVQVPFAQVTSGRLGGADLGLSQVTPTAEREKTASFSTAYLEAPPGVLARRGINAIDLKGLRELRWVVGRVSTLTPIVTNVVRPSRAPIVVEDRTSEIEVLRA